MLWYGRCQLCYRMLRSLALPLYQDTRRQLFIRSIALSSDDNMVRLIDLHGTTLGIMKKSEADKIAKTEGLLLTQVAEQSETITNTVYKLIKAKTPKSTPQHKSNKKTAAIAGEPSKELTMKSQIQDNDLSVKAKKLQQFLDRGFQVTIKIVKPRRVTQLPSETYERLVAMLECEVTLKGTPKSSTAFFRGTVVKRPETSDVNI